MAALPLQSLVMPSSFCVSILVSLSCVFRTQTKPENTGNEQLNKNAEWSPLALKIKNELQKPNLVSSVPLHNLIYEKTNRFAKVLSTGGNIFNEYKNIISGAKKEVLIASYFWVTQGTDKNKYGSNTNSKKSYAAQKIGEGLVQAQKNIPNGQKINVYILINELMLEQLKNDIFREFLEINEGELSKINQVQDAIISWEKMGLDKNKFSFKLASFEQYSDFNMHDKFIVVDSEKFIVGSANVKPENNPEPGSQHEVAMLVEGESAKGVEKYFKDKWDKKNITEYNCSQKENRSFCLPIEFSKRTKLKNETRETKFLENKNNFGVIILPSDGNSSPTRKHLESPQNRGWLSGIENAKQSIEVISPNISAVPFVEKIKDAILRGVEVRMITAYGHADKEYEALHNLFATGSSNTKVATEIFAPFLKTLPKFSKTYPVKIIQNQNPLKWYVPPNSNLPAFGSGPNVVHAKYLILDNQVVILGSGNQEFFSYYTSSELNALVDNKEFANTLRNTEFEPIWKRSVNSF
jgi:phosphatidylserine/phosphatidylglycerophosphate/cardiolipin synthase-like enzyme